MQLAPGEHSILAYFPSRTRAEKAMQALTEAGISEVQLDRISRYGISFDDKYNNPVAGQAATGTGLTLFSADTVDFNDNDAQILRGAEPSVQGYAPPGYEAAGGKSFLVTVVADDGKLNLATEILKNNGAFL